MTPPPAKRTKMEASNLSRVAQMMDEWQRSENDGLNRVTLKQCEQIAARNRYIAEQQEEFSRMQAVMEAQRQSMLNMIQIIQLQEIQLDSVIPVRGVAHRLGYDMFDVPHMMAVVIPGELGIVDRLNFLHGDLIDLTTDEEYDSDATIMEELEEDV